MMEKNLSAKHLSIFLKIRKKEISACKQPKAHYLLRFLHEPKEKSLLKKSVYAKLKAD